MTHRSGRTAALRLLASGLMVAAIGGCTTTPGTRAAASPPHFIPPAAREPGKPRVALVLSGGSARGFAHVGVIKVLERNGLRPDLVVGTSAGSIVGALYASGLGPEELERSIAELDITAFDDLSLPTLGLLPGSLGLVRGDKLHRFVDDRARKHEMEDFPIRFAAIATDLGSGEIQIFNAGDVGLAVRASSAVPGIIAPASIGGRLYSDGQLSSPMPVLAARQLGADVVIAVDVLYPPQDASMRSAFSVLFQAFTIATYRLKNGELAGADVVIAPHIESTSGQMSFEDRDRLVAAGEKAADEALHRVRPLFSPW